MNNNSTEMCVKCDTYYGIEDLTPDIIGPICERCREIEKENQPIDLSDWSKDLAPIIKRLNK